jgi:hypothetical protein
MFHSGFSQDSSPIISDMKWGLDYQIFMQLENDSAYSIDVTDLFHVKKTIDQKFTSEFVYYPVNLDDNYVEQLQDQQNDNPDSLRYKTLWSALHEDIGAGWVHFTNCLVYALETRNLVLTAPLLERPETKWKPKPVTESYRRTRKWDYYLPYEQKNAIKEYKKRDRRDNLGDVRSIPQEYVDLFLETNQKEYDELIEQGKFQELAKIDIVKVMLGANYLGEVQIKYIQNSVKNAIKKYATRKLPSVIIFDEFEAAAAMTMDAYGYKVNMIVFNSEADLSEEEMKQRRAEIQKIIAQINSYNQNSFRTRLDRYYN